MKKRDASVWCGLLILLISCPVTIWCGAEAPDTTAAALASKLTAAPSPPPPSLKLNSSTEHVITKGTKLPSASASVSLPEPAASPMPANDQQPPPLALPETAEGARVEELHSSFEEAIPPEPQAAGPAGASSGARQAGSSEGSSESKQGPPSTSLPPSESLSTVATLANAEPSLVDTLSSAHLSPLPDLGDALNETEPLSEPAPEAGNRTEEEEETVPVKEKAVSEATLPPDLAPRDPPTSTPSMPTPTPEKEQPAQGTAGNHSEDSGHGEEIPSFSEWAQKQLAEAEKRKGQNASEPPRAVPKPSGNVKLRSKNYASPDCGAKIAAANSEAVSVSSVLSPSRDEYVLNPCTSAKIWLVLELCEAIQAKQLELANFELFSSSPKEFSVFVSDRFPTRDWHAVGHFTAEDERTIQSFALEPHLFGKFMRVEFHSHWGSEHYCPVSLLRVYGTSEFEVLDTEEEPRHQDDDDDDDDELVTLPKGDAPKNLFGSARDAVMSIVKKAAQVLVKTGDARNATDGEGEVGEVECGVTPLPGTELCADCSPAVLRLLACRGEELQAMLASRYVVRSLQREELCQGRRSALNDSYLAALLPSEYLHALCHLLAALVPPRRAPPLNYDNLTLAPHDPFIILHPSEPPSTCSVLAPPTTSSESSQVPSSIDSEIRPTRTLKEQESSEQVSSPVMSTSLPEPSMTEPVPENSTTEVEEEVEEWSAGEHLDTILAELKEEVAELDPNIASPATPGSPLPASTPHPQPSGQIPPPQLNGQPQPTQPSIHKQEQGSQQATQQTVPQGAQQGQQGQQGQQKESVFVRLANRIKALERNMSLSAQYLEELSRRYKKQVEEMQRAFERTLAAVGEASRQASQREVAHAEMLQAMEQRLSALGATTAALLAERDSWVYKVTMLSQHVLVLSLLLLLLKWLLSQCRPSSYQEASPEPIRVSSPQPRRLSAEDLRLLSQSGHRKRRPSDDVGRVQTFRARPASPVLLDQRLGRVGDLDFKLDPNKRKRRKLRRELRGVSVEELCSGLSPATLAVVRPRPLPSPSSPRSRRHSTDSSPVLSRAWHPPPPSQLTNGTSVEILTSVVDPPTPVLPQRKAGGLRKMVRKLF